MRKMWLAGFIGRTSQLNGITTLGFLVAVTDCNGCLGREGRISRQILWWIVFSKEENGCCDGF